MKPNKYFEQKKKEKQVLVKKTHRESWKEQKMLDRDRGIIFDKREAENQLVVEQRLRLKGVKNGFCNRGACLSDQNVIFYNRGSRKYYCDKCSLRINEFHEEDPLCKTDEGQDPRQWRHDLYAKEREEFEKQIGAQDEKAI